MISLGKVSLLISGQKNIPKCNRAHFVIAHDITIKDPTLPVINVGSRQNPSYLPPEVCVVLPGQTSNTKLSSSQTQQMIRFAVRKPAQNAQSIATSGTRMLGFDPTNSTLVSTFLSAYTLDTANLRRVILEST